MNTKLVVALALIGLASCVSAICQCNKQNYKSLWESSDLIAHVRIVKAHHVPATRSNAHHRRRSDGAPNEQATTEEPKTEEKKPEEHAHGSQQKAASANSNDMTYEISYIKAFKPAGPGTLEPKTLITISTFGECGVTTLMEGSEYLISGRREDDKIRITSCESFPIMDNGLAVGPLLWSIVPKDLKDNLERGQF